MNCPKCSVPVEDGLLTCPVCGEQIAANAQKEKISAAYEANKAIVKKRVHTPVFFGYNHLFNHNARYADCFYGFYRSRYSFGSYSRNLYGNCNGFRI